MTRKKERRMKSAKPMGAGKPPSQGSSAHKPIAGCGAFEDLSRASLREALKAQALMIARGRDMAEDAIRRRDELLIANNKMVETNRALKAELEVALELSAALQDEIKAIRLCVVNGLDFMKSSASYFGSALGADIPATGPTATPEQDGAAQSSDTWASSGFDFSGGFIPKG